MLALLFPLISSAQERPKENAKSDGQPENVVFLPFVTRPGVPDESEPPGITSQPVDVTVTEPEAATFSVVASGDEPLTYQWRRDGVDIPGATNASYTLDPTSVTDDGAQFDVVVSNPYGTAGSQSATLTVNPPPEPPGITTQPVDVTVTEPEAATFSVVASGDEPLTYQWRRDGVDIPDATGSSYTLDPTSVTDDGAQFDVVVSNPYGTAGSQPATLTVNPPPEPPGITTQPADVTVTEPEAATFSVVASGDEPLSYQWRRDGVDIPGATGSNYTLDPTSVADDGAQFDVVVSNPYGNMTSEAATLTVLFVNVAPEAVDDNYTITAGGTIDTISDGLPPVLANDSDANGDILTATLLSDVVNGTLILDANGAFTYTHSSNEMVSLELDPGAGNAVSEYGAATAVDGDTLVVGSNGDEGAGIYSGAAYVFVRRGAHWELQAELLPDDSAQGHWFGWAVDIEGDTIVVGAPGDSSNGIFSGAAYVFVRQGSEWYQQAKLTADDAAARDEFGVSVAIDGETIVVGAHLDNNDYSDAGSAYIFRRSGTNWTQQAKLTASDQEDSAGFGLSVDADADTIVVGAYSEDTAATDAGAVYVFVDNGVSWSQQSKLTAVDAAPDQTFGFAVSLKSDTLVVGANGYSDTGDFSGAAYLFSRNGTIWSQTQKLTAPDATTSGSPFGFGVAVAFDGNTILVGANGDDELAVDAGSVYLFTYNGSSWTQKDKRFALNPSSDDEFGVAVAVDGNYAAIGANSVKFSLTPDNAPGDAYVYQIAGSLTDSFTYVVNDGTVDSNVATVLIALEPDS